jgi:nitroreductase
VVVAAKVNTDHKVPAIEQVLAAGAAAMMVILAANALGYGAMWRTGASAYSKLVKAAFGLGTDDAIVGYIYLGNVPPQAAGAPTPTPTPAGEPALECVTYWDKRA